MFSSVQLADGLCVLIANARSLWHNDSLQSLCSARRVSTSVRYVVKSVGTALRDQLANDLQPASGYCHRQSSIAVRVSNVAHLLLTPPCTLALAINVVRRFKCVSNELLLPARHWHVSCLSTCRLNDRGRVAASSGLLFHDRFVRCSPQGVLASIHPVIRLLS